MTTREALAILALLRVGVAALIAFTAVAAALCLWQLPSSVDALMAVTAAAGWTCWLERRET